VAVDSAGNVFVADNDNCTIRKVTSAGVVTTLAGSAGVSGTNDGTGSAARFAHPCGVAVDSAGNVFVADSGNHTIRKVTPAGVVTTLGGSAGIVGWLDGTDGEARFCFPTGVAVDSAGNVFVADGGNRAIRKGWPTSGGVGVTITVPPQSLITNAGATVAFSVAAIGTGQLSYQWRFNGANIPGATDVMLSLTNAQLASAGDYGVVVTSSLGSAASAAAQLILLMQTNRQATVAEIGQSSIDPNSQLQVYTNGAFKSSVGLDPNRMTIVLTHGWNSSFGDWPAAMAPLFVLGSRTPTPNIVAWDWEKDAASDLIHIYVPVGNIPKQGDALGKALLGQLGPNYSQPIHFIGHSFGTLVNARAADYLHGDGPCVPCRPAKGVNAFLPANTQMTLFDEAELAPDLMNDVLAATEAIITGVPVPVQPFYGSAMPKQSRWADNYISAVGLLHLDAANVIFTRGLPGLEADFAAWSSAVTAFHGYPYGWYDLTVPVCSASLMGDQWSFEQSGFASAPEASSVFLQTAGVSPLDLAPTDMLSGAVLLWLRFGEEAASLGIAVGGSLGADPIVQVIGQVLGSVGSDLSSLYVRLQTGLGSLLGPNGLPPNFPKGGGGGGGTNAPACAWIPLAVPPNAVSMSFHFMVQGDGQDDSFAVALGGTNVLSLAMDLIQTNVTLSSGLIRVSPWAGQTVELFLGIVGGTSTNASLTAGGISFYGMVPPSLQAQAYGSNLVVTWPVSADAYALETSTSLTGTNSWAAVTNVPAIVNFQNTVTNAISAGSRFYRLNKAP
jgi:pimeloyl-ACP methyl ester carboxylesterase